VTDKTPTIPTAPAKKTASIVYAVCLFTLGGAILTWQISSSEYLAGSHGFGTAAFFFCFGVFTITMGYARPGFGHVSFDRVAQVASILVLGPVDAAWISGLASLVYPIHRLWKGVSAIDVMTASLHNAGMMIVVILACGSLYTYLGGPIPLQSLNPRIGGLLLLLMLSMQALNDGLMAFMLYLRDQDHFSLLNVFSISVELISVPLAILVAIVFSTMDMSIFVLLLFVLSLGMVVLKQFAEMRNKLEALVDERTEALRQKSIELERQATRDQLTGLYNRRFADDFLQRQIDNSRRNGRKLTIALADIDHFKKVNDTYSHAAGDKVLLGVSKILLKRCRQTDMVARYGGEEFLLCFPDTPSEFAEQICVQIREAIEKKKWTRIAENVADDFRVTISFGVAEIDSQSRLTSILHDADTRLYQAKHRGRNRIVGLASGS